MAKWITPFDRQPHHLTDISSLSPMLRPGGMKMIKFQESGWPNSLLTLKLRLYKNTVPSDIYPKEFIPAWNGTVLFNPDYDENRPPIIFEVPSYAEKVEFVPEMIRVDRLLTNYTEDKNGVRVVVDEFGGFVGLIGAEAVLAVLAGWWRKSNK